MMAQWLGRASQGYAYALDDPEVMGLHTIQFKLEVHSLAAKVLLEQNYHHAPELHVILML